MNAMRDLSNVEQSGFVHIYAGDGKGKTTAAAGLAARAAGHGLKVVFCQFLKGMETGEIKPLESLGVQVFRAGYPSKNRFLYQMNEDEREETSKSHRECLESVAERLCRGGIGLLVLDEALDAVNMGMIDEGRLIDIIKSRPPGTEIVLTGREPTPGLSGLAGYRTDFVCVSHPHDKGVKARKGIEY